MHLLNCVVVAEVNSGNNFNRSDDRAKSCEKVVWWRRGEERRQAEIYDVAEKRWRG